MANTIAIARGVDGRRVKEVHRLGSVRAVAEANTWRTFCRVSVDANGSSLVTIRRDGVTVHTFELGPEGQEGTES